MRVQTPDSPGRDVCEQGASPGKHATLSAVDRSDRVLEQAIVVYLPPPAPPAPPVTPAATAAPTVDAPSAQPSATASASTSVSAPASLQAIAQCESSGNAGARNGQYGGLYQFDRQTWQSVGGTGDPAQASPQEQTMRAEMLMSQRGSNPWPVCGAGK